MGFLLTCLLASDSLRHAVKSGLRQINSTMIQHERRLFGSTQVPFAA
jgi:hypothetical protein